jgi:hypothetical protein
VLRWLFSFFPAHELKAFVEQTPYTEDREVYLRALRDIRDQLNYTIDLLDGTIVVRQARKHTEEEGARHIPCSGRMQRKLSFAPVSCLAGLR